MITMPEDIGAGDRVFAWFSPFKDNLKRHDETEYKVLDFAGGRLKLGHDGGDYYMVMTRDILETWFGNIRKVK